MKLTTHCIGCGVTIVLMIEPDDLIILLSLDGKPIRVICTTCATLNATTLRQVFDIS